MCFQYPNLQGMNANQKTSQLTKSMNRRYDDHFLYYLTKSNWI